MMISRSRKIFLAATLSLVLTYFFPLWQITLDAPQYPEGIGMYIWLDKITGKNKNDLENINGLNHYIGMKKIEPDSIPELKIMPYIVAGLIFLGLLVFIINKKWVGWTWLILFIGLLIFGLYDYYQWGYDYGHNLDPKAAIKVPGMSYQPPLIGTKQILNFTSISLPYISGIIMGLSILAAAFALLKKEPGK
jgi:copper chaperone NosL